MRLLLKLGLMAGLLLVVREVGYAQTAELKAPVDAQAKILRKIHLTNQLEIKAGNFGEQKGKSQQTREFGKRLVRDHSHADTRVKAVAKSLNIDETVAIATVDEPMQAQETKLLRKLERAQGTEFDSLFADEMEAAHKEAISDLKDAKAKVAGTPTAALIDELLPTLPHHEDSAEALQRAAE